MRDVNLSNIYLYMIQFYGVKKFEVFSVINEFGSSPTETMIEFYYNSSIKVNPIRLHRNLENKIRNVNKFFVIVEESKIIVHIDFNREKGMIQYDLEYSMN
ncbi:hypothetical protein [Flavobacterium sp. LB2P74]|uniref:hypothetical protein n=1 Tax=Flavobacterium sp. LB2P74 TaxID=3401717 RepID=UPI003AAD2F73